MIISKEEFQKKRSPSDLLDFVEQLKQTVQADKHERHQGAQKEGLYKQFLDELIPLSYFAILKYDDSYKIEPVLGSQGYDARVFNEKGEEIDRIEITIPHDGAAEATDAKRVVSRGYGQTYVGDPGEDFDTLFPHVIEVCRKKGQKDYSDCKLVVAISPMPPFESYEVRYVQQVEELVREMTQIKFKAKGVFLLILPDKLYELNRE